ncbi:MULTISPECIES: phage major capsid protein, P2 family [Desulfoluna]|uniref:Phage major capsid protein, P2 family n=2 Tax=Desulfoluna TaxID=497721 RepID=A0A1G5G468_9BACT|nr:MULTISPECIES: phage major capsid protein, P2 family [Desulfoluna]SCY46099.1 phage major capsid protein, P2 family [Desulfoluna spongiiphila]VFQ47393.1 bacteriophage p2 gpn major capsid [Desulfoluna butyratoxydans]
MNNFALKAFNEMCGRLAKQYGIPTVEKAFTVEPTIEQKLQDAIVEKSTFLPKINVFTVDELEGQNILGCAAGPVSGRIDTSIEGNERTPRDLLGLGQRKYRLNKTNSDVYMTYATMDAWAKFPDLAERYTRYVQERIANDREVIGWYGTNSADTTDLDANSMLQDVNKGWMQYVKETVPANILTTGEKQAGEIRIGMDGDFVNLDHAVVELTEGIPPYLRRDLIVLVGSELVAREKTLLAVANGQTPSEKLLSSSAFSIFGGLPWETPSSFPERGLVITSYENLSIYVQSGSWRRQIKEKPEKDRVEDYNSRNEGYVVETPEKFVAVDFSKVKLPNGSDGWA